MKPNAYCINLDKHRENYDCVCEKFSKYLNLDRVSAVDAKEHDISGQKALCRSNALIFNRIHSEPYVIILEDDVIPTEHFDAQWDDIVSFITDSNNVDKWDFISLDFLLHYDSPKLEYYNDFFYKTSCSRNTGFMIYNTRFIVQNLKYFQTMYCIDLTMTRNDKFIKLIPKQLLVAQLPHMSTINKQHTDYTSGYKRTQDYMDTYVLQDIQKN